jgi:predicted nucleic acid-binding protein
MAKPLIFDSTPLIYLARSSLANLLKETSQPKFTSKSVFEEVVCEGKRKKAPEASLLANLFENEVLKVQDINDKGYLNYVREMAAENEVHPLHEAEAEVLCLTKQMQGICIADDKVARSVARLLGIELHGTGYVLGKFFATGKIGKQELVEKVREMRESGWYVSADDYLKIVEYLLDL